MDDGQFESLGDGKGLKWGQWYAISVLLLLSKVCVWEIK